MKMPFININHFKFLIIGVILNHSQVNAMFGWLECPAPERPVEQLDVELLTTGTWFEVTRDAWFEDDM